MPNPSTIAEMEAELALWRQECKARGLEISNLLHIIKEKNDIIKQLHLLLDVK